MHPHAARVLDRLAPRSAGTAPRLRTGIRAIDERLGGGLELGALHELRAPQARGLGAATGVAAAWIAGARAASGRGKVLWVTDPAAAPDAGFLCPDGLKQYGLDPSSLVLVSPADLKGALWAADEGARCTELAAVVLHLKGNPRQLDRVATRRLMIRARESGVFTLILRQSGQPEASAALTRWCVEPRRSPPDPSYAKGIGWPQMRLTLERTRDGQDGAWTLVWNPKTREFAHGPETEDPVARPAAPAHRPDRARPLGDVVAFRRPPAGAAAGDHRQREERGAGDRP